MREKSAEKFVLLPFALGCMSESSVAVASPNQNEPRSKDDHGERTKCRDMHGSDDGDREDYSSDASAKNSFIFIPVLKPNVSAGIHRLYRGLKSFSQLFVYKEDMEEEAEIEIGDPTDVKHVTHIGWDSCVATNIFLSGPISELPLPPASHEAESIANDRKGEAEVHTAKEISAKLDAATTNRGGGKSGLADRSGEDKGGHAKFECPHCKTTAPDVKSMQIHHDARHSKIPFDESNLINPHASHVVDPSQPKPGVRGILKK